MFQEVFGIDVISVSHNRIEAARSTDKIPGLLGLPKSPEKGKKRPFLARIGKSKNYL
jgi:hypothetical protein